MIERIILENQLAIMKALIRINPSVIQEELMERIITVENLKVSEIEQTKKTEEIRFEHCDGSKFKTNQEEAEFLKQFRVKVDNQPEESKDDLELKSKAVDLSYEIGDHPLI